jgi:site-specific DNA-methyltransferase (adenine-specific)
MKPVSEIKIVSVDKLVPYARNARTHSDQQVSQIASSIKEFGFNNPILIKDDFTVIAGHGRLAGAIKLGMKEVPTICLSHLTPTQVKAYILADNKLALNAGWDEEMLALEVQELELEGFDVSLAGFDNDEIAKLLAQSTPEGLTDEDEVPEVTENPVSRQGDIWLLGNHRVMCGDSTSLDDVKKLMNGKLADLWITDPPYNINYEGGTGLKIMNDSQEDTKFREFLKNAYASADANMKEGAVFYIWHAPSEGFNFCGACRDVGWKLRQVLIWVKSSLVMGRQDYQWKHEPCLYGWKEGAGHYWGSDRSQTTTLDFNKPKRNGEHPTMKPTELFAYQIGNSSKVGGVVLDSFGGSGTTVIACEQTGRNAVVMELDPKYVDVIVKRWQDFTGKVATLEFDGSPFPKNPNPTQNK